MKRTFLSAIALTASLIIFSPSAAPSGTYKAPSYENVVRVAVLNDADRFNLSVKGLYEIREFGKEAVLKGGKNLYDAKVEAHADGIWVGKNNYPFDKLSVIVMKDASIYINNRCFRGEIDIIKKANNKLLVVNRIDVEDYIRGVLYHEISHKWHIEAIKAQAIAVRTYALYVAQESKGKDFDMTSDIYSQVYGGATSEKWKTDKGANLTKGQVLTYNGKIFPTYYHATCAGHTEDAAVLWNINIPPLKGVFCNFCKGSPHYYWKREMKLAELEKKLQDAGYKVSNIISIRPYKIDPSGRYLLVKINNAAGNIELPAKDFRNIAGPNTIRSNKFKAEIKGGFAVFTGIGWGHGVGLCQWGTKYLAEKGRSADEILKFYYPQAEIEKFNE